MEKIIFYLTSSCKLAEKIAQASKIELGKSEVVKFSDGEIMARCLSKVKGKECYIVQSTIAPSSDTIFEILIFVDALKNAGAKEINLIALLFGKDEINGGLEGLRRVFNRDIESVHHMIGSGVSRQVHKPHIVPRLRKHGCEVVVLKLKIKNVRGVGDAVDEKDGCLFCCVVVRNMSEKKFVDTATYIETFFHSNCARSRVTWVREEARLLYCLSSIGSNVICMVRGMG